MAQFYEVSGDSWRLSVSIDFIGLVFKITPPQKWVQSNPSLTRLGGIDLRLLKAIWRESYLNPLIRLVFEKQILRYPSPELFIVLHFVQIPRW